jgi:tetratricopeptide (TPR) repeat protein
MDVEQSAAFQERGDAAMKEQREVADIVRSTKARVNALLSDSNYADIYEQASRHLYSTQFTQAFGQRESAAALLLEAINYIENSLERTHENDVNRAERLDALATYLRVRFTLSGELDHLRQAIKRGREARHITPKGHRDRAGFCNNLSELLITYYEAKESPETLNEAISLSDEAVKEKESAPDPDHLNTLANALTLRYKRDKDPPDCENAVTTIRRATGINHKRCGYWNTFANIFEFKYDAEGEPQDLEEALRGRNEALWLTEDDSEGYSATLSEVSIAQSNLSMLLHRRYLRHQCFENLERAIELGRKALAQTPETHPRRGIRMLGLGSALHSLYESTGSPDALLESIKLGESAVHIIGPASIADKAMHHNNLAIRLLSNFDRTHDAKSIRGAIDHGLQAATAAQSSHEKNTILINLSGMYERRSYVFGFLADLEEAIRIIQEVVKTTPAEHPTLPRALDILASVLRAKYRRTRDKEILTGAIERQNEALQRIPEDHPFRTTLRLGAAHNYSLQHAASSEAALLDQAIEDAQGALTTLTAFPQDHPNVLAVTHSLGQFYALKYEATAEVEALKDAISYAEKAALSTKEGDPQFSIRYNTLGVALHHQYKQKPDQNTLRAAQESFIKGLEDRCSLPIDRVKAGRSAGILLAQESAWSREESAWSRATDVLEETVKLLPRVSPRMLSRDDQQFALSKLSNLSALLTSTALEARRNKEDALGFLEAGRGMMAAITADLRSDLGELLAVNKEMARAYSDLREQLCSPNAALRRTSEIIPHCPVYQWDSDPVSSRLAIEEKLTALEEKIRKSLPNFQLPPSASTFKELVKDGVDAIVAFNVTDIRSDAFLVTSSRIRLCSLPSLEYKKLSDVAGLFVGPKRITGGVNTTFHERNDKLREALSWLWDVAVKPVLKELGFLSESKPKKHPRLVWVTSGLVGLLPLHAAGHSWSRPRVRENTACHVVSSYTPTFRALKEAQDKARRMLGGQERSFLMVTMPKTTGWPDLDVMEEAESISESVRNFGAGAVEWLGDLATGPPSKDTVMRSLSNHSIAYCACHGLSDAADPSRSGILLADGSGDLPERLTVRDIADMSLKRAELIYLSACHTADNESEELMDEVIHLASTLQMVGFPHVVGTMWKAYDEAANSVARIFFEKIAAEMKAAQESGKPSGPPDFAYALHLAIRAVRDGRADGGSRKKNASDNITVWAPFIHMGC